MPRNNEDFQNGSNGPADAPKWRMSPNMQAVYEYMKTSHLGSENRGNLWDIAAGTVTYHKGQYLTNAKHEAHFEALSRLIDNGLVKKHSGYEDEAWIPVPGEKPVDD